MQTAQIAQESDHEILVNIELNEHNERTTTATIPVEFVYKLFTSQEQMRRKLQRSAIISCKTTEEFNGQFAVIREGLLTVSLFATFKEKKRVYTLCGLPEKSDSYFNLIKKICLSFYEKTTPYSAL